MSLLPEEIVIAGILAAFAAYPDLIPAHLLQAHADSTANDIYYLPNVRALNHPIVISKPKIETSQETRSVSGRSSVR
jgi:hypothetical protein